MDTPRRNVHWDNGQNFSSPSSDTGSSASQTTTSTLQYVNSQILAQGFAKSPGLSLEGISREDGDRVVRCFLQMLSQRSEDLSRAEELSTKLVTLRYDHDRLLSMHKSDLEKMASAEKEANLCKSRLASASRSLKSAEAAHKQTTVELHRSRSSFQSFRQTQAAENKRRDKEVERMTERWAKISDSQAKIGSTSSGIRFATTHANAAVASSGTDAVLGKGNNMLEAALDDAEQARKELLEENARLKDLVVTAVNELAILLHKARRTIDDNDSEPSSFNWPALSPLAPGEAPRSKISSLVSELHESMDQLVEAVAVPSSEPLSPEEEVKRLKATIAKLKSDLEQSDNRALETLAQLKAIKNAAIELPPEEFTPKPKPQLNTASSLLEGTSKLKRGSESHDEPKKRVHKRRKEAESPTQPVSATGDIDEAQLIREAQEMQNMLDNRARKVHEIASRNDPLPIASTSNVKLQVLQAPVDDLRLRVKSPKKSPKKSKRATRPSAGMAIPVGKAGLTSGRHGRKSSASWSLVPKSPARFEPPFETEFIPPLESIAPPVGLTSSSQPLIASSTFVLPPPSPMASIHPRPDLLSSDKELLPSSASETFNDEVPEVSSHTPPTPPTPRVDGSNEQFDGPNLLTPPTPRPFPVAKPFATRMIHAYSPARPSPLSRILMMNQSMEQSTLQPLNYYDDGNETNLMDVLIPPLSDGLDMMQSDSSTQSQSQPSLPDIPVLPDPKMGISLDEEFSDESPLRDKNPQRFDDLRLTELQKTNSNRDMKHVSVRNKGRGDKGAQKQGSTVKTSGRMGKENVSQTKRSSLEKTKSQGNASSNAKANPAKGGARRVPIGSAEAAQPPAWKG